MSNIVRLNVPSRTQRQSQGQAALLTSFARERRFGDDVFWLKENAELLNILECTGAQVAPDALAVHQGFYSQAAKRLGFFPQYYRFLLSICLDLEDLGMAGNQGEALVHWADGQGLVQAEMSDLQRAEARRLMLRRGVDPVAGDTGLNDRLRDFLSRPASFAIPNKKAAYELTHTVFYLSEYGRKDPELGARALQSLDFAGTLAFLDLNADLLAEICVALRHAGKIPPVIWEEWLARHTHQFSIESGDGLSVQDDYHEFFVCNWLMAVAGDAAFAKGGVPGRMQFTRPDPGPAPLRVMSECLFAIDTRDADWTKMRRAIAADLPETAQTLLALAETASEDFAAFFAGFARAGKAGAGQDAHYDTMTCGLQGQAT